MDQQKPGPLVIAGAIGGRKVLLVHFGGKQVEPAHGFDKIQYRFLRFSAEADKQEPYHPYPGGHKIQVNIHPLGVKGDFPVQGMIHRRHRNAAGQESGFKLQVKKVIKDRFNTARPCLSEAGITNYPENSSCLGYIRNPFRHFFSTLIDAA
jgi:hypothetical protein